MPVRSTGFMRLEASAMQEQTTFRPDDLPGEVGLDDRPLHLSTPVGELDHRLGPPDAPLQLVEYGDYQCPFCRQAAPGVRRIIAGHGDGLLFVFRHFPLVSQHPDAWRAALTAEAAGRQDRFWSMHEHLLGHEHGLSEDELRNHARALGLDMVAYERDLQDRSLAERVREDALSGLHSGVLGTPTFFLNGRRLEGGFRQDELESAIEQIASRR
jgi:protein-disulfide isomerase